MATLFGKTPEQIIAERQQARNAALQTQFQRNAQSQPNAANQAAADVGTLFGNILGRKLNPVDEGEEIDAARQMQEVAASIRADIAAASTSPNASAHLASAAEKAAKAGLLDLSSQYRQQAGDAKLVEETAQYQDIFRATEQSVADEVDPINNPIKYNRTMYERLSDSNNPLAVAEASKYRDKAIDFQIDAAKAKAEEEGLGFDSPENTEVKIARTQMSSFLAEEADRKGFNIRDMEEEDLDAAAVEVASRAKDEMARNPNLPYRGAVAKAYQDMKKDGSIKVGEEGVFSRDKFKYVPTNISEAVKPSTTEQAVQEVNQAAGRRRMYNPKNGKTYWVEGNKVVGVAD